MSDEIKIQAQARALAPHLIPWIRPPGISARVYRTATQSISNNTTTPINFDNERWDTHTFHDNSTNNTRLTIPFDGYYICGGNLEYATTAGGGRRSIFIRLNGATRLAEFEAGTNVGTTDNPRLSVVTEYSFVAGDYVELCAFQSSGGALNVNNNANNSPEFWIIKADL